MRDRVFELNSFLTRSVYLVVAALMRGYLGTDEGEVRIALAGQAERKATRADRLRLARDLHDVLLPSLTGTALLRETSRRRVETDPLGQEPGTVDQSTKGAPKLLVQCIRKVHPGGEWIQTRSVGRLLGRIRQHEIRRKRTVGC